MTTDHARTSLPSPTQPARTKSRAICPHCGGGKTAGHGSFRRKDGTREARRLCHDCGRTFNLNTGTPFNYIKKRAQWVKMRDFMPRRLSVRRMANYLRVPVVTVFRWRHRIFSALAAEPQPILTGSAIAGEAYAPYSEKGSWTTGGPGARKSRAGSVFGEAPANRPFRRIKDGKASCVLLATSDTQQAVVLVGQGRPKPEALEAALARMVGAGVHISATGLAPYTVVCQRLGIPFQDAAQRSALSGLVSSNCARYYGWMRFFRGVATKYLCNYLCWFSRAVRLARCPQAAQAPLTAA